MDDLLVGLDEYKVLNKENPVAYTRDICSCIAILVFRENSSELMHIEATDDYIELDKLSNLILSNKEDPIKEAKLFLGPKTNNGNVSIITFILQRYKINYTIHKAFRNLSNEYSVGFNYNTKEYYMATMDKGNPIFKKRKLK